MNRDVHVTGSSSASSAGFDPGGGSGGWSIAYPPAGTTGYLYRYAENSKLPKAEQLLSVAAYIGSYNAGVPRKGAALAAGWSLGNQNYAWTGEVDYDDGGFNAVLVEFDGSYVGWDYVGADTPAAVCLP